MNSGDLAKDYIESVDHVLESVKINEGPFAVDAHKVRSIVENVKAYLEDAKYYLLEERFEVSLASVTYCEGLLDALRMLGTVGFEWPQRKRNVREK